MGGRSYYRKPSEEESKAFSEKLRKEREEEENKKLSMNLYELTNAYLESKISLFEFEKYANILREKKMQAKNAGKIGVWGGTGSGKSTRAKELIEGLDRVIVIDPIGDWASERGFHGFTNLIALYRAIKRDWNRGFKFVLITPRGSYPEAMLNSLADGIFLIQEPYKQGKKWPEITLVVEEMALTYPEKTLSKDNRNFMELINLGRHSGVNIIGISQRMAEVKKGFISNCSEHYFFRMGSHVDYAAVGKIIGGKQVDKLKELDDHHALHFCRGKVTLEVNKFIKKLKRFNLNKKSITIKKPNLP